MLVWAIIVTLAKFILFFIILYYNKPLYQIGSSILSVFTDEDVELIFVMIVCPMTLNTI